MADANGVPRRVSMAYILGFSNKPYKEVRLPIPPPPPQARKPSQPVSIVGTFIRHYGEFSQTNYCQIPTPGHIMEWTASDGRKGKLTGAGKPRLTAASLAKVPSDKRSTKEALSVKSTSKKATATKPAVDGGDGWVTNTDWAKTSVKDGNKDSDSKKGNEGPLDNTGNESNDPLANSWGNAGNAAGGDDKTDEKKDETTSAWDTPTNAQTGPEAHDNPVRGSEGDKKDENKNAWTKEQDEKLMHMKAENVNVAWNKISQEFGKTEEDCRKRFKAIKPNAAKQGGEGKKGKEKRQNHDQNQSKGGNKKDAKNNGNKEEEKKDETSWVAEAWDMPGGNGDVFPGLFGGDTDNNKDDSGNKDTSWDDLKEGTTGAGTSEWDTKGGWGSGNMTGGRDGADAAAVKWDSNSGGNWNTASNNDQDKKKDGASIADPWNPTAPVQNSPKQTPSQTGSQHKASSNNNAQPITTRPLELEVKPDDTFSADDLRLVARILQQDCSMVWNRVSWRFRDKTGRTLHPDEFEKKITGRLEGKDCEKSKRR
ncbi:hypothetical protein GT037_002504 [Alternaria burnsii]|uniref:Myb-like domain-containing protein n=1 Tax=Alternaria burnsii TaxID=1187904 RepID=A0A8H7EJ99_9PLEO|nr:uncharacterized protein GT037_002504 [Alternaria burnsii]KAF7680853.1 hypothetical protein GT037_002504 [Alternaria burnsii]